MTDFCQLIGNLTGNEWHIAKTPRTDSDEGAMYIAFEETVLNYLHDYDFISDDNAYILEANTASNEFCEMVNVYHRAIKQVNEKILLDLFIYKIDDFYFRSLEESQANFVFLKKASIERELAKQCCDGGCSQCEGTYGF